MEARPRKNPPLLLRERGLSAGRVKQGWPGALGPFGGWSCRLCRMMEAVELQTTSERSKGLHGKARTHRVMQQRRERLDAFDVMVEPMVLRVTECLGCGLEYY